MIYIHAMLYFVNISYDYLYCREGCNGEFCALSDPVTQFAMAGRNKDRRSRLGNSCQKKGFFFMGGWGERYFAKY